MKRLQLDKDIQPLSEFRAHAASMIEKVKIRSPTYCYHSAWQKFSSIA